MKIRIATTDAEIEACWPVMRELRPHIAEDHFVFQIRHQEPSGYRLAYVQESDGVVAVAGFRIDENLAWGRFLYVDDLVTLPGQRSKGYGAKLLSWLKGQAAKHGCEQIHLDSGTQRKEAHRFYEREGMVLASFHFVEKIAPNKALQPTSPLTRRRGRAYSLGVIAEEVTVMKKALFSSLLLIAFAVAPISVALGQVDYSDPEQRNPQGDKDVEEGYQKHQKEHKEKQEKEERKEKGEIEDPYEVDRGGVDDANRNTQGK